jgi:hypothetical protein
MVVCNLPGFATQDLFVDSATGESHLSSDLVRNISRML